jgi:hypothetical protein
MKCFAGSPQDILDAQSAYHSAPGGIWIYCAQGLADLAGTRPTGSSKSSQAECALAERH